MIEIEAATLGRLLGLVVHDLRNPTATVSANVAFIRGAVRGEEMAEAISDVEVAVAELMLGFEQVAWIGRCLAGDPPLPVTDGDLGAALAAGARKTRLTVRVSDPPDPIRVVGAGVLPRILEVLLANSERHARDGEVHLAARREGGQAVVELTDTGRAVGADLRDSIFTAPGQLLAKTRADGRYGRVLGLLAAAALADSCDATLEADGRDGAAVFRVRMRLAEGS